MTQRKAYIKLSCIKWKSKKKPMQPIWKKTFSEATSHIYWEPFLNRFQIILKVASLIGLALIFFYILLWSLHQAQNISFLKSEKPEGFQTAIHHGGPPLLLQVSIKIPDLFTLILWRNFTKGEPKTSRRDQSN